MYLKHVLAAAALIDDRRSTLAACRQEVETDQFYNFFLPELKQDGYDGIFSPKSRAKTMGESERKYVDGCAIFFRSAKYGLLLFILVLEMFALVKEHLIEFNQLAMANSEGSDNMLNRVMPKDNIGLAALIKTKEAAWENGKDGSSIPTDSAILGQPILVCTAHIHWDPEFCDVKLIQTMMLSNELRSILDDSARTLRLAGQRDNVQLLLCGDFNSLPDSGVVEFLSSGRVSSEHRDFKELGYAGSLRRMPGSEHEFTHNFKLASAYSEDIMPYTNYTKQSMTPLGLLGPLSQDWFREHKVVGCPHPHIPSGQYILYTEQSMTLLGLQSKTGSGSTRWWAVPIRTYLHVSAYCTPSSRWHCWGYCPGQLPGAQGGGLPPSAHTFRSVHIVQRAVDGTAGATVQDSFREHKVVGCPHLHKPSGQYILYSEQSMALLGLLSRTASESTRWWAVPICTYLQSY
ncbi:unnamed protein product [Chilo suppressalis]|uniref:Endonuclease/exonuclease/phosphatase domain-containing protein n=1 Tax=Chilo suppressalis TaxID=168631 RepID=A0ABN8AVI5_CHISP|nr:unnamed protein product [Chilo suppressalis]